MRVKYIYRNTEVYSTQQGKILNVWRTLKRLPHVQRSRKIRFIMKKNRSLETDSEIIQMIDSVGWDLHTVVTTIIHMFRKIDERLNTLSRDRENIKNTQIELIDTKTIMSEMFLKNMLQMIHQILWKRRLNLKTEQQKLSKITQKRKNTTNKHTKHPCVYLQGLQAS